MNRNVLRSLRSLSAAGLAVLVLAAWSAPAVATWSIAAVERETGLVGVAGASCTNNVQGIGEVVPGKGVVVVQAMSSDDARDRGVELLRGGATPAQIVKAMRDERFDPENQQFAVVSLSAKHAPATYSGTKISQWTGTMTGDGVSVQGNILVGESVVAAAFAAFPAAKKASLAARLVQALVAGAEAGGDQRCGEQRARSAFVTVYRPDDDPRTPYFHIVVYGVAKGGEPAVALLEKEFDRRRRQGADPKSTRLYIVP